MREAHMAGPRTEQATRSAISVFSVDTPEQAEQAIVRFGILRYDGSIRWTYWPCDFDQNAEIRDGFPHMEAVTARLREWWDNGRNG